MCTDTMQTRDDVIIAECKHGVLHIHTMAWWDILSGFHNILWGATYKYCGVQDIYIVRVQDRGTNTTEAWAAAARGFKRC